MIASAPENGAPFRSTLLESYPSPGESILGSKPHTMKVPHSPIIPWNADKGASCYPTPPSYDDETSSMGVRSILLESGSITVSRTENINEPVYTNAGESSASMMLAHTVQNVKRLLFSCDSTLNEIRVQRILHVSANPLIAENLEQMLRPLLSHWNFHQSLDVSALGLPAQWRGIGAAANYLRILDFHREPSITTRFGQVLLYFNYEELCRDQNKLTRRTSLKADKTDVLNYILEVYHNDPNLEKGEKFRRNRITGYHLRRGKWWWRIAGTLGVGILLLGNASLVHDMYVFLWFTCGLADLYSLSKRCGNSFTDAQVKAFVSLSVKTQLGSKCIFEATELLVKSIISGHGTRDPHAFLFHHECGLLRPEELARIRNEDEQALLDQLSQTSLDAVDIVENAKCRMKDYLG